MFLLLPSICDSYPSSGFFWLAVSFLRPFLVCSTLKLSLLKVLLVGCSTWLSSSSGLFCWTVYLKSIPLQGHGWLFYLAVFFLEVLLFEVLFERYPSSGSSWLVVLSRCLLPQTPLIWLFYLKGVPPRGFLGWTFYLAVSVLMVLLLPSIWKLSLLRVLLVGCSTCLSSSSGSLVGLFYLKGIHLLDCSSWKVSLLMVLLVGCSILADSFLMFSCWTVLYLDWVPRGWQFYQDFLWVLLTDFSTWIVSFRKVCLMHLYLKSLLLQGCLPGVS